MAGKTLRLINSNYKIAVNNGYEIILDPTSTGNVRIIGNLIVEGDSTTVESANLAVSDNIISVNVGETGNGITANNGTAGLRVDRGEFTDAQFVFREGVNYLSPTLLSMTGVWSVEDINGEVSGLRTNAITTDGGDLFLINEGLGVISVTGTLDYENQVIDDDHIPNKRFVEDYVTQQFAVTTVKTISDGTDSPTYVQARDFETTTSASVIEVGVNTAVVAQFFSYGADISNLSIADNTISSKTFNADLILEANTSGSVRIASGLLINEQTSAPLPPDQGTILYSEPKGPGNTGVYFVNTDSTNDEIISNNRALVYSMIF